MEKLFGSQHKIKNLQMRHTRCVGIINYFDRWQENSIEMLIK